MYISSSLTFKGEGLGTLILLKKMKHLQNAKKQGEIFAKCILQFRCSKPVFLGNPQQDPHKMHLMHFAISSL